MHNSFQSLQTNDLSFLADTVSLQTSIQQELEDTMQEREGEIAALVQEVEELKKKLSMKDEETKGFKDAVEELEREKTEADADKEK
ncbi:hypothetical protein PoB_000027600, partial [Plakobranchus ocellatus]